MTPDAIAAVAAGAHRPDTRAGTRFYAPSGKNLTGASRHLELQQMITIVAGGSAKADRVRDLAKLALDLVGASRSEAGNVSYDFYEDVADPAKFTFIEVWKDQAAIEAHNASSHFQEFVEKAGPLFAGPLDVALYRKLT